MGVKVEVDKEKRVVALVIASLLYSVFAHNFPWFTLSP